MHSTQVRSMLKGYGNHAAELGYHRRGAVRMTQPEMHTLLISMHEMQSHMTDTAAQLPEMLCKSHLLVPHLLLEMLTRSSVRAG